MPVWWSTRTTGRFWTCSCRNPWGFFHCWMKRVVSLRQQTKHSLVSAAQSSEHFPPLIITCFYVVATCIKNDLQTVINTRTETVVYPVLMFSFYFKISLKTTYGTSTSGDQSVWSYALEFSIMLERSFIFTECKSTSISLISIFLKSVHVLIFGRCVLEGVVQCEWFSGEESRHSSCRHHGCFENVGEQIAAAAVLQSSHQNWYVSHLWHTK